MFVFSWSRTSTIVSRRHDRQKVMPRIPSKRRGKTKILLQFHTAQSPESCAQNSMQNIAKGTGRPRYRFLFRGHSRQTAVTSIPSKLWGKTTIPIYFQRAQSPVELPFFPEIQTTGAVGAASRKDTSDLFFPEIQATGAVGAACQTSEGQYQERGQGSDNCKSFSEGNNNPMQRLSGKI